MHSFLNLVTPLGLVATIAMWPASGDVVIRSEIMEVAMNPETSSQKGFTLCYSTLGYERGGTKRALLRSMSRIDPASLDTSHSTWQLLDYPQGASVMSGELVWLGETFGCQLWEIDFSDHRTTGTFSLHVDLKRRGGRPFTPLESLPFEVDTRLHSKRTLTAIAIENAEAREATESEGGGYYDCNWNMGEAHSHGVFLAGLAQAYDRRQDSLTSDERDRLIAAANRAVDYLLMLHDNETGEIRHQHPSRINPHIGVGPHNTYEGLWGMATYANIFKDVDPNRAREAYERGKRSLEYLGSLPPPPPRFRMPALATNILAHFHAYSGSGRDKKDLLEALDSFLSSFDPREGWKSPWRAVPYFEGLHYCVSAFPDHRERTRWVERAGEFNQTFFQEMLRRNHFHVMPQGGRLEWDDMESVPAGFHPPFNFYANTQFGTMATDAIHLAQITGDVSLEKMAAGALGWLTGLNPGVPGKMVKNPGSAETRGAASFIINLPTRCVKPWKSWDRRLFPQLNFVSIVNGFAIDDGTWAYSDEVFQTGETWFKHDGAYLYAICLYEDYLESEEGSNSRVPVPEG